MPRRLHTLLVLTAASCARGLQLPSLRRSLEKRAPAVRSTRVVGDSAAESLVYTNGLEIAALRTLIGNAPRAEGMTRTQSAKALFKQYGASYLLTSISLALVSYALSYTLVARGFNVAKLLQQIGLQAVVSPNAGTATLAYAVHKAASPIRFPPTVALTPLTARLLKRVRGA
jgi:hypothetical protein